MFSLYEGDDVFLTVVELNVQSDAGRRWADVYREAISEISDNGLKVVPTRGPTLELLAYKFKLKDARDRCLLHHPLFDPFAAVGHWLWTMAGRMDLESIQYYNENAARYSVDQTKLHGAYGPRLFGIGVFDQVNRIIQTVSDRDTTRRAVAVVYLPEFDSFRRKEKDREDETPCTVALQFLPRDGALHAVTFMRSQDALRLLPQDVFLFTLIQEYVAACTSRTVGSYHHLAGSFHYYLADIPRLEAFLKEQPTHVRPMPRMPPGDQLGNLNTVLKLEEKIRNQALSTVDTRSKLNINEYIRAAAKLPDFWKLAVHSLIVVAGGKVANASVVHSKILEEMDECWRPYLRQKIERDSPQKGLGYDFRVKE